MSLLSNKKQNSKKSTCSANAGTESKLKAASLPVNTLGLNRTEMVRSPTLWTKCTKAFMPDSMTIWLNRKLRTLRSFRTTWIRAPKKRRKRKPKRRALNRKKKNNKKANNLTLRIKKLMKTPKKKNKRLSLFKQILKKSNRNLKLKY